GDSRLHGCDDHEVSAQGPLAARGTPAWRRSRGDLEGRDARRRGERIRAPQSGGEQARATEDDGDRLVQGKSRVAPGAPTARSWRAGTRFRDDDAGRQSG